MLPKHSLRYTVIFELCASKAVGPDGEWPVGRSWEVFCFFLEGRPVVGMIGANHWHMMGGGQGCYTFLYVWAILNKECTMSCVVVVWEYPA